MKPVLAHAAAALRNWSSVSVAIACALSSPTLAGCDALTKLRRREVKAESKLDAGNTWTSTVAPWPIVREDSILFQNEATKANVYVYVEGPRYRLSFSEFPSNAKVTVNRAPVALDARGKGNAVVDLTPLIVALAPSQAFDAAYKLDPRTKIGFEFGAAKEQVVDAKPISIAVILQEHLRTNAGQPMVLGAGPKAGEHSAILVGSGGPLAVGPARTVGELDFVAVGELQPPRKTDKTCDGYAKTIASGQRSVRPLEPVDTALTLYELRTGKKTANTVIAASEECPKSGIDAARTYASRDALAAWIKLQLSRR